VIDPESRRHRKANDGFAMTDVRGLRYNSQKKLASFEFTHPGTEGRRRSRKFNVQVTDIRDARRRFEQWREQIEDEVLNAKGSIPTVGDYFERFWEQRLARKLSPATQRNNRSAFRNLILPFFSKMRIDRITDGDVETFTHRLEDDEYSPSTINFALRRFRELIRNARKHDPRITRLPEVKLVTESRLENELTLDEERRFLAAFDDQKKFMELIGRCRRFGPRRVSDNYSVERRFGAGMRSDSEAADAYFLRFRKSKQLFLAALRTGLRSGDLLRLRWAEVQKKEGEFVMISLTMRKTSKACHIPLSADLREVLKDCAGDHPVFVFVQPDGQPYAKKTMQRYFSKAKKIAGIERRLRIHDLRHSFGSRLAGEGVNLLVIRDVLGHSSVAVTERYSRPDIKALNVVAEALDRVSGAK
jgi:integrase